MAAQPSSDWCGNNPRNEMRMAKVDSARRVVLTSMSGRWGSMVVGGPVLKFVSSKTVSPLFSNFWSDRRTENSLFRSPGVG
jgi:hypothetical protein